MNPMTVSLVLTIHDRSADVQRKVRDSFLLPGNAVDEAVIVLDRPTPEAERAALEAWSQLPWPVRFLSIPGEPKWICPARAWNHAYRAATSDLLYQISSEVVQESHNVDRALELARDGNTAVFGSCHNSVPSQMVTGAPPGLLADSTIPRPLGFIVCYPRQKMLDIGCNDETFMDGLWYEDDDLFLRLWRSGVNFTFDDAIHGVHLDHDRASLNTPDGQQKIQKNASLMMKKHGTTHPWPNLQKLVQSQPGRTRWTHL